MPSIQNGTRVGQWDSNFGKADITTTGAIGKGYPSAIEAHKAIAKSGTQGAIVKQEDGSFDAYKVADGARLDDLDAGEKFQLTAQGKAAGVVDFIGDDGASLSNGTIVKAPKGADKNETVYFTRTMGASTGLKGLYEDTVMAAPNHWMQSDDIARLQEKGYTVVVDNTATKAEIQAALYDPTTVGWVNFGHGAIGAIVTHEEDFIFPDYDITPEKVSQKLKLAYIQSCQVGEKHEAWQKALGPQTKIYDWDRSVTNAEVMMVNGGKGISFGSVLTAPGASTVLNPYAWMGKTLSQAIEKNL